MSKVAKVIASGAGALITLNGLRVLQKAERNAGKFAGLASGAAGIALAVIPWFLGNQANGSPDFSANEIKGSKKTNSSGSTYGGCGAGGHGHGGDGGCGGSCGGGCGGGCGG